MFPELNADILCLQECTQEYLKMLNKSHLRDVYQISNFEATRAKAHFPLILSKIPFNELLIRDRTIYGLFEWKNTSFIVVCVHLNVLGKNKIMRAIELTKIHQNLQM